VRRGDRLTGGATSREPGPARVKRSGPRRVWAFVVAVRFLDGDCEPASFPSPAEPPIGTFYQSAGARSVQAGTRGAKRRGGEALTGRVTADTLTLAMGGGVGEGMP